MDRGKDLRLPGEIPVQCEDRLGIANSGEEAGDSIQIRILTQDAISRAILRNWTGAEMLHIYIDGGTCRRDPQKILFGCRHSSRHIASGSQRAGRRQTGAHPE